MDSVRVVRRHLALQTPKLLGVRFLGNAARGPPPYDVAKNFKCASKLFTDSAVTYDGFKQQCESFRLFLFGGVVTALTTGLFISPPKSSYWRRWSPFAWPAQLVRQFMSKRDSVYTCSAVADNEGTPVWHSYAKLIGKRRD